MEVINHQQAFTFLTEDELRQLIPSAFTQMSATRASSQYINVPTPSALQTLKRLGWEPVKAYQVKPKKADNVGFQKHFIHLRNPKFFIGAKDQIELIPEITCINSYDARCSLRLLMAMNRPICGNGLIVQGRGLMDIRYPHRGPWNIEIKEIVATIEGIEKTIKLSDAIGKNIENVSQLIKSMQSRILTNQEQKEFAHEACRARWDYTYRLSTTEDLLSPLRPEDQSPDLFTVYNRIQEKFMKGGWKGAGGRAIKALKDPNRALRVNTRLFEIAEDFLK